MLYLIQGTGLVLALITVINAGDNPIKIQPDKLVVEFGASASANCSINTTHHGMGWNASQGGIDMVDNVQSLTWKVESLTEWDINPFCYVTTDDQWQLELQVTVYKRPDRVSISTVNHTGPMIEGRQYELQCDVQNVAPVHLLNVNWYKELVLVDTTNYTGIYTKLPVNQSTTLQIFPSKKDHGVQYKCEAVLNLAPEVPVSNLISDPLSINISTIAQSNNCSLLVLDPPELVVQYGDPVSVNCHSLTNSDNLSWRVSQEQHVLSSDKQNVTWETENLTDWEIEPVCSMMVDGEECAKSLPVIVYKLPDQVSISVVDHTGPLIGGKKYDLQCDIQNFAPVHVLAVFWYKGGEPVKNRGFGNFSTKTPSNKTVTLRISVGKDEENVQYRCAAKLKLRILSFPMVESNLLQISVHNKPVISCSAWSPMINTSLKSYPYNLSGNPSPNITWYRDKAQLNSDMRLGENDSGQYKIVASNLMGETSCTTNIRVEYAPIFNCSGTYEVKENGIFKDECLAKASPEANITWEKDGKIVNSLHNLTRGDSGSYVIKAMNQHGSAQHNLTVNVLYAPKIEPDKEVVKVKEGSKVFLNCTAEGNPEPELNWSVQSQIKATGRQQTTLTFFQVSLADAGVYTCTATNSLGNDTRKVSLIVEGDNPIKIQPDKLVVEFGALASANCSINSTHLGMGWEASQGVVDMVDNVQSLTWMVESLTHWDIKPFCYVITDPDKQWQLELQVTVYKHPDLVSISTVSHTGPMIEGRQYELQCDVQNVAPVCFLNVNWYKGQQLVHSDSFTDETKTPVNKTMTLQVSTQRGDDGVQYRCEAELKLGPEGPQPPPRGTSDPLSITVHYGPEIQLAKTLEVKTGNDVSLNCTAIGNPEPEVRWSFRNQFKTNWSRQAILKITKAESDHRGQYTCTATNKLGSQTATVSLEIKEHQFSTIIIISLIIIIIIIIICIIIYLCIKKRRSGKYDIQPNCAITMSLLNTSK